MQSTSCDNRDRKYQLQSQTISWLRFPLIICVIFIHNSQLSSESYPLIIEGVSSELLGEHFRIWISWVLTHICVPCFFVISGFLFFMKTPDLTYSIFKGKISKRFRTLLIPYILWNLIPLFVIYGVKLNMIIRHGWSWQQYFDFCYQYFLDNGGLNIFWACNVWGGNIHSWFGTSVISTGPYNLPLWYLRNLIVISLFTPILYWLIKNLRVWFFLPILLMYFGSINLPFAGFGTSTILFFGWGAYIAINRKNLICEFRKFEKPCYIVAIVSLILATIYQGNRNEIGHYFYCIYVISGVISIFNIGSRLIASGIVRVHHVLVNSVFFIYAFHTNWFMGIYDRVICKVFTMMGLSPINLFTYLTTPFAKAAICIAIYVLLEKYTPKLAKILNGSR